MDSIRKIISIARRQLLLATLLDALAWGLVAGAIVAVFALLALKFLHAAQWSTEIFLALIASALLLTGAVVFALRHRGSPSEVSLALRVDDRLKLEERFTSALALDGWSRIQSRPIYRTFRVTSLRGCGTPLSAS